MLAYCIVFHLVISVSGNIYVDDGYPYEEGQLSVSERTISPGLPGPNSPVMHSRVFYPNDDSVSGETFGVYYFITGFFGTIPPGMYDHYVSSVAAHGYVAISTWPVLGEDGVALNFTAQSHLDNIDYLDENLPSGIRNIANFDYLATGCHSAGCAPTLRMGNEEEDRFKAIVNIEPVTFAIRDRVHFTIPGMHMGAELANGSCAFRNWDFERFYDEWRCPRMKMEVANASHCGILGDVGWNACRILNVCPTEDEDFLPIYHNYLQGMTSAYLHNYVQGNDDMLQFVTDPDLIPIELLQQELDIDCDKE